MVLLFLLVLSTFEQKAISVFGTSYFPGSKEYLKSIATNGVDCPLRCPDEVVVPSNATDVAMAVQRARKSGLTVNVRGGGHSMWCQWAEKDGILIDLSSLQAFKFIPADDETGAGAMVHIQGGATFDMVLPKLNKEHNMFICSGLSPSVGMGGIYTGGGWHLFHTPHYGWCTDNIVGFTLVTPGGSVVTVNDTGTSIVLLSPLEPDLAKKIAGNWLNWMAKGTWSSFGIITDFIVPAFPNPVPWMTFRVIDPWSQEENLFKLVSAPPDAWSCGHFGLGIWGFDKLQAVACTKLDPADNRTVVDVLKEYDVETIGALPLGPNVFEICEGRHGGRLIGLGYVVAAEHAPKVMSDIATWKKCLNGHAFQGGGRFGLQTKTALPWAKKAVFAMVGVASDACAQKLIDWTNEKMQGDWKGIVHMYPNWGDCGIADFGHVYWGDNYEELVNKKKQWDPTNVMGGIQSVGSAAFENCWEKAPPADNCVKGKVTQREFSQIWSEREKQCEHNM